MRSTKVRKSLGNRCVCKWITFPVWRLFVFQNNKKDLWLNSVLTHEILRTHKNDSGTLWFDMICFLLCWFSVGHLWNAKIGIESIYVCDLKLLKPLSSASTLPVCDYHGFVGRFTLSALKWLQIWVLNR